MKERHTYAGGLPRRSLLLRRCCWRLREEEAEERDRELERRRLPLPCGPLSPPLRPLRSREWEEDAAEEGERERRPIVACPCPSPLLLPVGLCGCVAGRL